MYCNCLRSGLYEMKDISCIVVTNNNKKRTIYFIYLFFPLYERETVSILVLLRFLEMLETVFQKEIRKLFLE